MRHYMKIHLCRIQLHENELTHFVLHRNSYVFRASSSEVQSVSIHYHVSVRTCAVQWTVKETAMKLTGR